MSTSLTDPSANAQKPTALTLRTALRLRLDGGEWALFWEVGDGRRADALAMNLWRSRGYAVHGFELKVSRGDWLKELKVPAKSDAVMKYCDRWWVVTPAKLIGTAELPEGWGLLELRGDRLVQKVPAPKLRNPRPLDRAFMSQMLRRDASPQLEIERLRHAEAIKRVQETVAEQVEAGIRDRLRESAEYRIKYESLLEALGGNEWSTYPDEVKRIVRAVMSAGVLSTYGGMNELRKTLDNMLTRVDNAIKGFEADG